MTKALVIRGMPFSKKEKKRISSYNYQILNRIFREKKNSENKILYMHSLASYPGALQQNKHSVRVGELGVTQRNTKYTNHK